MTICIYTYMFIYTYVYDYIETHRDIYTDVYVHICTCKCLHIKRIHVCVFEFNSRKQVSPRDSVTEKPLKRVIFTNVTLVGAPNECRKIHKIVCSVQKQRHCRAKGFFICKKGKDTKVKKAVQNKKHFHCFSQLPKFDRPFSIFQIFLIVFYFPLFYSCSQISNQILKEYFSGFLVTYLCSVLPGQSISLFSLISMNPAVNCKIIKKKHPKLIFMSFHHLFKSTFLKYFQAFYIKPSVSFMEKYRPSC